MVAAAHFCANTLDAEGQVGARTEQMHAVGALHAFFQRGHGPGHLAVIHRADVEIQIFKRLGAHVRALGHAGGGPAQDTPAGFVHALVKHRAQDFGVERLQFTGHIPAFARVRAPAHGDVRLHFFHAEHIHVAHQPGVLLVGAEQQLTIDAGVAHLNERNGPRLPHGAHQGNGKFIRDIG